MKEWLKCCWQALCMIIPFLIAAIAITIPIALAGVLNKPLITLISFPVLIIAIGTIMWLEDR